MAGMTESDNAAHESNKRVVRRHFEELLNGRNFALAPQLFHPTDTMHISGRTRTSNLSDWLAGIQQSLAGFPDTRFTVHDLLADGDKVIIRRSWTGTHTGVYRGIPPTGRQVTVTGTTIYRLEDGKIAEQWVESDELGLMLAIGGVVAAPGRE
jgi:predicted ester cyclase